MSSRRTIAIAEPDEWPIPPSSVVGRFAPSPTGDLHLGNVRTALLSWLSARAGVGAGAAGAGRWIVRMEDLDRVTSSRAHEQAQLDGLAWLGLDWDGPVIRQSDRFEFYREVLAGLAERSAVYHCYCTRREIQEAAHAPHGTPAQGVYPGTCRTLSARRRAALEAEGRRPAVRLRAAAVESVGAASAELTVEDRVLGTIVGTPDDIVLQRNDGVPAYHLAVVVDDAAQQVTEVVRADDLAAVTPHQVALQRLLGLATPAYAHVPLVHGPDGHRLAKRHGAATAMAVLRSQGVDPRRVVAWLAATAGLPGVSTEDSVTPGELLTGFSWPSRLHTATVIADMGW